MLTGCQKTLRSAGNHLFDEGHFRRAAKQLDVEVSSNGRGAPTMAATPTIRYRLALAYFLGAAQANNAEYAQSLRASAEAFKSFLDDFPNHSDRLRAEAFLQWTERHLSLLARQRKDAAELIRVHADLQHTAEALKNLRRTCSNDITTCVGLAQNSATQEEELKQVRARLAGQEREIDALKKKLSALKRIDMQRPARDVP